MYSFNIINDYSELSSIQEQWGDLLDRSVFDSFFCSHHWICSWWEVFSLSSDKMVVVVVRDDEKLIAIAPFMIRSLREYGFKLRVMRFIGVPNADRCDLIIREGYRSVVSELVSFLLNQVRGWDQLHLNEVPEKSLLAKWLKSNKPLVYVERGSVCPFIPLMNWETWDDYYGSLSRNTRKLANRKGNRLDKEGSSHYFYEMDFSNAEQCFRLAGELEKKSRNEAKVKNLVLGDAKQYNFHKRLFDCQNSHKVLLVGLLRNDALLAYLYGFIYKNIYYAYNTAYCPEEEKNSPGLLVFRETIKHCKLDGISEFDFLRGAMQIKKHWAKDKHRTQENIYFLKFSIVNMFYVFLVFKLRPCIKNILKIIKK